MLLLGGLFVFFGVIAYVVVSLLIYNQIDNTLEAAAGEIIDKVGVNRAENMDEIVSPELSLASNIYFQVWSDEGELVTFYPRIGLLTVSVDEVGKRATQPIYRTIQFRNLHLRVLSIPIQLEGRRIGVVQVASNLDVVDSAQRTLLIVLIGATLLGIVISAVASRGTVSQLLAPLSAITEAADQINRADDLSRRVPYEGSPENEVGQLVDAFNQTLERLEVLFTSQHRFLADVSHELRTPLTVIKGNVDLMRRMKTFDPESLDSIDEEANRLTRLVTDLLVLAKAEAGSLPLTKSALELDTLLMEVFNEMRVLAGNRVRVHLAEIDQLRVTGDRDRLKQVLINLVANAIKFTPAGGDIFLSLGRSGDHAKLIVRDTGPGIPAEDLPHIFDRFYRAEKSRTRSATAGFGLGLSIAHWIVEQHGGKIEVSSQEGRGTTFAVWIPLIA